jgi:hypothetical protein
VLLSFFFSCVVPVGQPIESVVTPRNDIPEVEFRSLEDEIQVLLQDAEDVDSKDRLLLLKDLIQAARLSDPQIQRVIHRHVSESIRIEKRAMPIMFEDHPFENDNISGQIIDHYDTLSAKVFLESRQFEEAIILLDPCKADNCYELWAEAREGHVYQLRDEAAVQFLRAKSVGDPTERDAELLQVIDALQSIIERYPSTLAIDEIQDNVRLVQLEIKGETP